MDKDIIRVVLSGFALVTWLAFVVISAGASTALAGLVYMNTHSVLALFVVGIWCVVLSLVGQGYVRYYWMNVLDDLEEKPE